MDIKTVSGTVAVNDAVFGRDFSEGLVHQVVVACMAAARSGTKAQKNRSAVSGGGKKPWAQKGSGRARAGTTRSPLWRHGGVTFAAQPRDFSQKVNKKQYRAAMCSILSELVRQERLVVVSDLGVDSPKTKTMVEKLKDLGVEKGLLVTEAFDENVHLSSRNIIGVNAIPAELVEPVSLVAAEKVVITEAALKMIEEKLS